MFVFLQKPTFLKVNLEKKQIWVRQAFQRTKYKEIKEKKSKNMDRMKSWNDFLHPQLSPPLQTSMLPTRGTPGSFVLGSQFPSYLIW